MQLITVLLLLTCSASAAVAHRIMPGDAKGEIVVDLNRDGVNDTIRWGNPSDNGAGIVEAVQLSRGKSDLIEVIQYCDAGIKDVIAIPLPQKARLLAVYCSAASDDGFTIHLFRFEPDVQKVWTGEGEGAWPSITFTGGNTMLHLETPSQSCNRAGSPAMARRRSYVYRVGPDLTPRYSGFRWTKTSANCDQLGG